MINRNKITFIAALLVYITPVFTQQLFDNYNVIDYREPREYEIGGITVSGLQFLDQHTLIAYTGLNLGDRITVPGDDITKVIEKLWDQGLFSDVKVSAPKIEGNLIYLDFYLKERPRLSQMSIVGLKKSETRDIMEKINIRTGSQVTEDVLNNIKTIINRHFTEKGFFHANVNIVQSRDTTAENRVNLRVFVQKNDRVKIDDIIFTGNEEYEDRRLRRVLKNTKRRNLNIFKSSKFIRNDFKEDKQKLISFYNEHGYRDATILYDSIKILNEKRINLYIVLEEGNKYYFRNIDWVGNTQYPSEVLNRYLGIEKGDIYNRNQLDKRLYMDEDAVNSLYLDNGYLFSSITPVEVNIDNDSIDIEMRVYEGKQATINKVLISGNTKTNEHVIRRELRTLPGELFSKSDIIRSVRELAQLGHFDPEKIDPTPIPNPQDGTVDLEYRLVEKANDQLEISGGWGANMLVGTIGLRFSNFSARNIFNGKAWRPIPTGDGQTLSLRAQSNGRWYQSYNMTFIEPWFGGNKPNSFSVSLYYSKFNQMESYSSRNVIGFMETLGASLGLGRRLSWPDDYFNMYNEIGFQQYNLKEYHNIFASFGNGRSNNISFRTTFGRNSVSQPIYPRSGSSFSVGLQLTPPYSAFQPGKDFSGMTDSAKFRWTEYHKWTFKSEYYLRIAGNLVLFSRANFGFKGYYNKDIGHSPFEGYYVGGDGMSGYNLHGRETIALRGYSNGSNNRGSLTPLNGANLYNKFTLELRYPFSLNPQATIFGLVFLEGGNAWHDFNEFNPFVIRRSAGVGLRAFLPMFGLLGVDWGYGFDEIPWAPDASRGQFHFTIGQQF